MRKLANRLSKEFGVGYSVDNLELFRRFYLEFPQLVAQENSDALGRKSASDSPSQVSTHSLAQLLQTGLLNPNLSWTHYRLLLRISSLDARAFYEFLGLRESPELTEGHFPIERMLRNAQNRASFPRRR